MLQICTPSKYDPSQDEELQAAEVRRARQHAKTMCETLRRKLRSLSYVRPPAACFKGYLI